MQPLGTDHLVGCLLVLLFVTEGLSRVRSLDCSAQLACFNQLMARFGAPAPPGTDPSEGVQYIAVGDGLEEEEISEEVTHQHHCCYFLLYLFCRFVPARNL